jgi:hypothetical protein
MDQATSLLRQAPFDRPTVLMLCLALEDAWLSVRPDFVHRKAEKAGRMNVADGILALARSGQRNPEILRRYAISRALSLLGPAAVATKNTVGRRIEISVPLSLGGATYIPDVTLINDRELEVEPATAGPTGVLRELGLARWRGFATQASLPPLRTIHPDHGVTYED